MVFDIYCGVEMVATLFATSLTDACLKWADLVNATEIHTDTGRVFNPHHEWIIRERM